MKQCPYCGRSIPDASHYCANCGKAFADLDSGKSQATTRQTQPPTSFTIRTDRIEGDPPITVLILGGSIDAGGARILQNALRKYTIESAPRVLIDFAGVASACSAGYSVLIGWARERESDDPNTVAIVGVNKRIMQELRTMGIAVCLPIFEERESALATLTNAD